MEAASMKTGEGRLQSIH